MKKVALYFLFWLISFFQGWGQTCSVNSLPANFHRSIKQYYPFCNNSNEVKYNTNAGGNENSKGSVLYGKDRFGNLNSAYQFDGQSSIKII